jgi:predicted Holliday junction resolvase-like endonuclease|tara:strand:- start:451 stop:681 length:231 start_codon:yes stop_codon:yes gene_type:complete
MMTLLFLSLAVIIAIVVILVSAKFIKAGFDARGEVKEQQRNENVSQEDEEILDKLKDKNLSPEDLKKIYEDLQKKK